MKYLKVPLSQLEGMLETWAAVETDEHARWQNGLFEMMKEQFPSEFEAAFKRGCARFCERVYGVYAKDD